MSEALTIHDDEITIVVSEAVVVCEAGEDPYLAEATIEAGPLGPRRVVDASDDPVVLLVLQRVLLARHAEEIDRVFPPEPYEKMLQSEFL